MNLKLINVDLIFTEMDDSSNSLVPAQSDG